MAFLNKSVLEYAKAHLPAALAAVPVAAQVDEAGYSMYLHNDPDCVTPDGEPRLDPVTPLGVQLRAYGAKAVTLSSCFACGSAQVSSPVRQVLDAVWRWVELQTYHQGLTRSVAELSQLCSAAFADPDGRGWAGRLLTVRQKVDFPTTLGVPHAHPVVQAYLGPFLEQWWTESFTGWSQDTAALVDRVRSGVAKNVPGWDGPLQLVTPNRGTESPQTLAPALVTKARVDMWPVLAVADCVGIIGRTGLAPAPVLAVPATVDLAGCEWVSLGSAREGSELAALLAACSATFAHYDVVDDHQVAAVQAALGFTDSALA